MLTLIILTLVAVSSSRFDIQIHSWNDLREWPAMFKKGITSFKIDLYYLIEWRICNAKHLAHPCLILHHSYPNEQFYSGYQALEYLATHHTTTKLRVSLCNKYWF